MDNNEFKLNPDSFEVVGPNIASSQQMIRKSMTYWQDAWRRLKKYAALHRDRR